LEKLTAYATPAGAVQAAAPKQEKPKSRWGKWYTWVVAGAVVALVVGLLVAQNVGSDKLHITAMH
jgi:hypothetical protein